MTQHKYSPVAAKKAAHKPRLMWSTEILLSHVFCARVLPIFLADVDRPFHERNICFCLFGLENLKAYWSICPAIFDDQNGTVDTWRDAFLATYKSGAPTSPSLRQAVKLSMARRRERMALLRELKATKRVAKGIRRLVKKEFGEWRACMAPLRNNSHRGGAEGREKVFQGSEEQSYEQFDGD